MNGLFRFIILPLLLVCALGWDSPASAQLGKLRDKVKKKTEEKVDAKVDQKIDESLDKALEGRGQGGDTGEEEAGGAAEGGPGEGASASGGAAPAAGGTAVAEDMRLYTKYDFVPGEKVIFYDDLAGEEIGEFPSRWNLERGVFEVVKQHGRNWVMCTDAGEIRPRVKPGSLPEKYTVELDFYNKGPDGKGHWYHIVWLDAEGSNIGQFAMHDRDNTSLQIGSKTIASKQLPAPLSRGAHTMRIMATRSTIKCYIDSERVANVPAVEGFAPAGFAIKLDPWLDDQGNPMLMGSFRYAEGGKTLRQQLDEAGRIVTHGILFDSGSAKIKAESYKTLADIGALLREDAALRLSIEGHTDADGADDHNAKLSQDRAHSVRAYLTESFQIDGARLEAKGWGEAKPIDTNDTAEGKANNRRVELVKL